MATLCLYYGASLDGFIEGENGDLSWLPDGNDFGYEAFYQTVGTVLMGRKTYEKVLSFGTGWHYLDTRNFVVSNSMPDVVEFCEVVREAALIDFVKRLKATESKRIWLVGGPKLHGQLLNEGLVDEIILTVIPALVGSGVRFMDVPGFQPQKWNLEDLIRFEGGVFQVRYERVYPAI